MKFKIQNSKFKIPALLAAFFLFNFSFFILHAQSTNLITAKITVITATSNNFAFTLNADTRVFTNAVTAASSQIITNHTVAGSASNLVNHIAASAFAGPVRVTGYTNGSNVLFLRGALGQAMSATILSNWATVSYSTQVFSSGVIAVRVPIASESAAVSTNVASGLVAGMDFRSTNAFSTNSTALTNHVNLGPETQRLLNDILTNSIFQGGTVTNSALINIASLRGVLTALTNGFLYQAGISNSPYAVITNLKAFSGYLTNLSGNRLTFTNLSAPGSGLDSEKIGKDSIASGVAAIAFGVDTVSSGLRSAALGYGAVATNESSIALGELSVAHGLYSVAIGLNATATNNSSVALGAGAVAGGSYSTALGAESVSEFLGSTAVGATAVTTTTNQIRLGTASEHVSIPGELRDVKATNIWSTGTNRFDLAVSYSRTNITSLANGANDLDPGLKEYLKVSGPTAAYSIDKIDRGWDGREITIQWSDVYTHTIVNNSGAGVLGDAAKILTGTGGTLTSTNNPGSATLRYDSAASRWWVLRISN